MSRVRPGRDHRADRAGAPHVDVLRPDPPAAAVRALGPSRHARPVAASAWSRTPVRPARPRSSGGWSSCSPRGPRGSSTAPPRASSPPAAARSGWSAPAPSAAPGRVGRCPSTTTARSGAPCPTTHASPTSATRRRPRRPGATPGGRRAFTVGDLGRIDDDGYLYLDGRRTDLIITGGVNVYPLEVENALRELPGVERRRGVRRTGRRLGAAGLRRGRRVGGRGRAGGVRP